MRKDSFYPAHLAHIAFCTPSIIKTTERIRISRPHIYSKGGSAPLKPPVYREQNRGEKQTGRSARCVLSGVFPSFCL